MSKRDPRIKEFFDTEIEIWCDVIANFEGEVDSTFVHRLIKEYAFVLRGAIKHCYSFDILEVSEALSAAAKYLVPQKEICFSILGQFHPPYLLEEDQIDTMTEIVELVEEEFGGAHDRLERRWSKEYEINNTDSTETNKEEKDNQTSANQEPLSFDSMPLD